MTTDERPLEPYDGILLLSFGGPEKPEDVLPFLRTVTAGKNIPDERLEEVGEHYYGFGGRSPINDQNRALLAALRAELDRRGISTPVIWGNRNFTPFTAEALAEARRAGYCGGWSPWSPAPTPPTPRAGSTARTWPPRRRRLAESGMT